MNAHTEKLQASVLADSVIERLLGQVRAWARDEVLRRRLRQERRQLAVLPDALLGDIGISRADAEFEAARRDIPEHRREA